MAATSVYTPIGGKARGAVPSGFFMLDLLLETRSGCGYPSNREFYDEDVNVYLADLLTALVYTERHAEMARLVVPYDVDLFELVARERDPRMNLLRYRVNGDFLLACLGIFDNPTTVRPAAESYRRLSRETFIGRGAAYYRLAWAYAVRTFRGPSALGEVMAKLSRGFERYVGVLGAMKGEYFNIFPRLGDGEIYHLQRSVLDEDRRRLLPAARDAFLDAFSRLGRERTREAREELERAVAELRELDPAFRFDLDAECKLKPF